METALQLRKRKAVEYIEDDIEIDEKTPKKKAKTVTKAKAGTSSKKVKKSESTKTIPKSNETKVSRSKVTKVENNDEVDLLSNHENNQNLWNEAEMLAQVERIPLQLAQNLIGLLTEGCTLPFIARYRKTAVDNLMPDR